MKNKLMDLNDHLFAQLERLSDEDITGDRLTEETIRAKAIGGVTRNILDTARLALKAREKLEDSLRDLPEMFGMKKDE